MTQKVKIKIAILRDLDHVPDQLLQPDDAVIANARLSVVPSPTRVEIEDALTDLEQSSYIIGVRNELSGKRKWRITDAGRLALKSL